ncbi:MAG: tetratricopeptide repeat protein, partial [Planctomycetaceae bacterium]|nr:tetratricopeptide repeat protein [Planctomycetaceae bacterium]
SNSDEAAISQARLYRKAGTCLEDGTVHLARSIALARAALARKTPGASIELANSLLAAAHNAYLNGRHIEAAEYIDESLELLRGRSDQDQILAEALERDGDVRIKLGALGRSSESFRESIRIREALLSARPFDVRIRFDHMNASMKLGSALAMAEHFEEALVHARSAIADSDYLIRVDGNNSDYCGAYISSWVRLAMIFRQQKDYAEALTAVTTAVERAQSLIDNGNNDFEVRRQLGFALLERGRVHRLSGEYASAVDDAQTALATRIVLADEQPDNLDYPHEVAAAHDLLGLCLQRVDRHAEAYNHLIASCTIHEKLIDRQPDVPDRKLNLAQSRINLVSWHMRLGTAEGNQNAMALLKITQNDLNSLKKETPSIAENKGFEACLRAIQKDLKMLEHKDTDLP